MLGAQSSTDSAQRCLLPRQEGFQTGHRIHMEVEAIGDVQRLGSSTSNRESCGEAAVRVTICTLGC